jgi:hypothetical protein
MGNKRVAKSDIKASKPHMKTSLIVESSNSNPVKKSAEKKIKAKGKFFTRFINI